MTELYTPDYDWIVTGTYNRLHHANLTRAQAKRCEDDGGLYDEPVRLACGINVTTIHIPGMFTRGFAGGGAPRCIRCCKATGLPQGNGSPKNDTECRRLLGMDPS
jgi:hypothetical protein